MKVGNKYWGLIVSIMVCLFAVVGCTNKETINKEANLKFDNGDIVKEQNGVYTSYNLLDNKYTKVKNEGAVSYYNKNSGNYIYLKNGKNTIRYNEKDIEIKDDNIIDLKLSPNGEYLSYFKLDDYYNLKIINLKENEEKNIHIDTSISGNLVEWLSENKLVYYGIDSKKNNGIFTYDLEEDKEELIYKLDKGYVEFLKVTQDGIVVLQNIDNEKILKLINNGVKELSKEILQIKDIIITKKGIFTLANVKNNGFSLYEIKDGKLHRMVYDFPNIINVDKGLSATIDGNILFIGSKSNPKKSNIYILRNGYVELLTNEESEYYFIKVN